MFHVMDVRVKIEIVQCYYESGRSATGAIRQYKKQNKLHNDPFTAATVLKVLKKFENEGCVAHHSKGAGRPCLQDERTEAVSEALRLSSASNTHGLSSTSAVSNITGISRSSVYNILRFKLNKYPYRLQLQHELLPPDYAARRDFAVWFLNDMLHSLDCVLWSDESYFHLDGGVNTHNAIIWADEKPLHVITKPLHPQKVCVWIGFTSKFMLEPVIFDQGTIDGRQYFEMLRDNVIPQLKRRRKCSSTIFMQDGAPPHIFTPVKDLLTKTFTVQRVISRNFQHSWPSRSPDINPCDYYLWSHMKQKVYCGVYPKTIEELKKRIFDAATAIANSDSMENAVLHLVDRLQCLVENNGHHIEPFQRRETP